MEHEGRVRIEGAPSRRCPFCHDAVGDGGASVVCDACLARHHAECWEDLGRCAGCGSPAGLGRLSAALVAGPSPRPQVDPGGWRLAVAAAMGGLLAVGPYVLGSTHDGFAWAGMVVVSVLAGINGYRTRQARWALLTTLPTHALLAAVILAMEGPRSLDKLPVILALALVAAAPGACAARLRRSDGPQPTRPAPGPALPAKE